MRVSHLENDLDSGESWRKQSDGTLVTLSVQESSAEPKVYTPIGSQELIFSSSLYQHITVLEAG